MKKIIDYIYGRTDRFNYFLSLLIVIVGFFYIDWFCNDERCLVCHPLMSIPWRDLFWNFFTAIGGIYISILICIILFFEGYWGLGFIIAVSCSIFWTIQTIRRCNDRNESEWRIFIPFYPLLLLFLPGKIDNGQVSGKALVYNALINGKWLILILVIMIGAIFLENSWNIQRHKRLYDIAMSINTEEQTTCIITKYITGTDPPCHYYMGNPHINICNTTVIDQSLVT